MHPDAYIAALQAELDEINQNPEAGHEDDTAGRIADIDAEIRKADGQPRPVETLDNTGTMYDRGQALIDAMKVELAEAQQDHDSDREAEIREQIGKLQALRQSKIDRDDFGGADEDEDKVPEAVKVARKRGRQHGRVTKATQNTTREMAVNVPGAGDPPLPGGAVDPGPGEGVAGKSEGQNMDAEAATTENTRVK
jgi:hypothetical protein